MTIARRIGLRGICSEGGPRSGPPLVKRTLNLIFFTIETLNPTSYSYDRVEPELWGVWQVRVSPLLYQAVGG